ncbi:MAG TPA: hypothetical protein VLA17_01915 [Candidatus Limnocylindria bacterium]|nr:hypothetical protein [Candidatus Limnocylindria bacterium]
MKLKLNIPRALPQRTAGRFLSKPLMNRKSREFLFLLGRGRNGELELFVKQPTNPPWFVREGTFERHVLQPAAAKHIQGPFDHFDRLRMLIDLKVYLRILVQASRRYRKIFMNLSMPPLEKRRCQRQATEVDPSAGALKKLCMVCMKERKPMASHCQIQTSG